VLSAVTGVSGLAILKAMRTGVRAPATLAPLRARPCQPSAAAMAQALQGHGRTEPRLALPHAVAL